MSDMRPEVKRNEVRRLRGSPLRLAAQAAAVSLVVALFGLLVWKLIVDSGGSSLVADVRADSGPSAPPFELPVIWNKAGTWPAALRPALADGRIALAELAGYPVVLNFWASWCVPCKEEAPHLAASARAHAGEVAFLGIDIQDFTSDARKFLREVAAPYVSVRDGSSTTFEDYGLTGIPETYYLDARGRVLAHAVGAVSRRELEAGIARARGAYRG